MRLQTNATSEKNRQLKFKWSAVSKREWNERMSKFKIIKIERNLLLLLRSTLLHFGCKLRIREYCICKRWVLSKKMHFSVDWIAIRCMELLDWKPNQVKLVAEREQNDFENRFVRFSSSTNLTCGRIGKETGDRNDGWWCMALFLQSRYSIHEKSMKMPWIFSLDALYTYRVVCALRSQINVHIDNLQYAFRFSNEREWVESNAPERSKNKKPAARKKDVEGRKKKLIENETNPSISSNMQVSHAICLTPNLKPYHRNANRKSESEGERGRVSVSSLHTRSEFVL